MGLARILHPPRPATRIRTRAMSVRDRFIKLMIGAGHCRGARMRDLPKSYHLGSRLGAVLDRLIADRPDLGWTEVAALFESMTGRKVSGGAVAMRYRRKSGT